MYSQLTRVNGANDPSRVEILKTFCERDGFVAGERLEGGDGREERGCDKEGGC